MKCLLPCCHCAVIHNTEKGNSGCYCVFRILKQKNVIPETLPASKVKVQTRVFLSQKLKVCTLPDAGWSTSFFFLKIRLSTVIFHAFKFRILSARGLKLRQTSACLNTALLHVLLPLGMRPHVGTPLKLLLIHWWLSWLWFARRTEGIMFMVSKKFSLLWIPHSPRLIFSNKSVSIFTKKNVIEF